jgi:hypothetical protein
MAAHFVRLLRLSLVLLCWHSLCEEQGTGEGYLFWV